MKAAGHELKGLMEYMDCRVKGLHFPLMVLVDYRGYRLIAESILPLGPNTLIYGSSDGGRTTHADVPEMNARMEAAANILNLKGHYVYNWERTEKILIHGPIDIEGHLGKDNRFYVLDTARVFPPQTPAEGVKGSFLYRLLRPELVKNNSVALSSDAFSRWPIEGSQQHNAEVVAATKRMKEVLCKEFGQWLDECFGSKEQEEEETQQHKKDSSPNDLVRREQFAKLVNQAHRKGINVLCLGIVRSHVHSSFTRALVFTEIVARTCKNILRAQLRKLKSSKEEDYHRIVLRYFNILFSNTPSSAQYWATCLPQSIAQRFPSTFQPQELLQLQLSMKHDTDGAPNNVVSSSTSAQSLSPSSSSAKEKRRRGSRHEEKDATEQQQKEDEDNSILFLEQNKGRLGWDLRDALLTRALFQRLQDIAGVSFKRSVLEEKFEQEPVGNKKAVNIIDSDARGDVRQQKLQPLLRIPLTQGDLVDMFAVVKHTHRISFEEGTALSVQAATKTGDRKAEKYFQIANEKFQAGLRIKPDDYRALHNWGLSLSLQAMAKQGAEADALFTLAEQKFKDALTVNPKDDRALFLWGNMLCERSRKLKDESDLLQKAITPTPSQKRKQDDAHKQGNVEEESKIKEEKKQQKTTKQDNNEATTQSDDAVHALLVLACKKYQQSHSINSNNPELLYNWGNVLLYRAKLESGNSELYKHAVQKYSLVHSLKPSSYTALKNWSVALSKYARSKKRSPRRADALFSAAEDKFSECIKIKPNDYEVYFNWGNTLYRQALMADPKTRNIGTTYMLLLRAAQKYLHALFITPNYFNALYNWGKVLHSQLALVGAESSSSSLSAASSGSSTLSPKISRLHINLAHVIDLYLFLFCHTVIAFGPLQIKLKPLLALAASSKVNIKRRALGLLNELSASSSLVANSSFASQIRREAAYCVGLVLKNNSVSSEALPNFDATKIPIMEEQEEELTSTESEALKEMQKMVEALVQKLQHKTAQDKRPTLLPSGLSLREYKVTIEDFDVLTIMGESSFERELLVRHRLLQSKHFLSIINKKILQERLNNDAAKLQQEANDIPIKLDKIVTHPFLLPVQWTIDTEDHFFIIYQTLHNEDTLESILFERKEPQQTKTETEKVKEKAEKHAVGTTLILPESLVVFYAAEIVLALQHLHALGFVFGALAPSNVYISAEGHIILAKFYFKRPKKDSIEQVHAIHNPSTSDCYISPEELSGGAYDKTTDWWQLGNLIYQMLFGVAPFHCEDISKKLERVMNKEHVFSLEDAAGVSTDARSLLLQLLQHDPDKRIRGDDIKHHPFFADIDWNALEQKKISPPGKPVCSKSREKARGNMSKSSASLFASTQQKEDDDEEASWRMSLSEFDRFLLLDDESFEMAPTMVANLKKGRFRGWTLVAPKGTFSSSSSRTSSTADLLLQTSSTTEQQHPQQNQDLPTNLTKTKKTKKKGAAKQAEDKEGVVRPTHKTKSSKNPVGVKQQDKEEGRKKKARKTRKNA
ncbi:Clu domain-containing protein [Balamuthia mandrillaris]